MFKTTTSDGLTNSPRLKRETLIISTFQAIWNFFNLTNWTRDLVGSGIPCSSFFLKCGSNSGPRFRNLFFELPRTASYQVCLKSPLYLHKPCWHWLRIVNQFNLLNLENLHYNKTYHETLCMIDIETSEYSTAIHRRVK